MDGLGDLLMLYPYPNCYHHKFPDHKLIIVMHHALGLNT